MYVFCLFAFMYQYLYDYGLLLLETKKFCYDDINGRDVQICIPVKVYK